MIDIESIINTHYTPNTPLHDLLITHSELVAQKAISVARQLSCEVDLQFINEAAMLHDIGIIHTHAPSIYCHGTARYITHGIIGSTMLKEIGLHAHALVCERHTGAGLTAQDIISQNLPLPHHDMLPTSIEEKIICYADKFFSKSDPLIEKSIDEIRAEMARFGTASLGRFDALHTLFV